MKRLCVFCGSSVGVREAYHDAARAMGTELARRGITLVYGGGHVGLMGIAANAVLAAGGQVIGVIPKHLVARELALNECTELRVVETMHERKMLMSDLSDAFVAMPGGYGTYDEFCEILTWAQLGLHRKPCGILNVEGFYDPLLAQFDHATREGFVRPENREMVLVAESPAALLDQLETYQMPVVEKWITRQDR